MRQSSFNNKDIIITRELSTSYDTVKIVADNINDIVNASGLLSNQSLNTVADNIQNISTTASMSSDIGSIVTTVVPNITAILESDDNAQIATLKANEAILSAEQAENAKDTILGMTVVQGEAGSQPSWNPTIGQLTIPAGINGSSITDVVSSKSGKTTTIDVYIEDIKVETFTVLDGVDGAGNGDMIKSIYDTNNDGKVNSADIADSVPWGGVTSKPDPTITVTLTGDVTGTANTTLTDLASGEISVSTTIAANSVTLGTDTTGNYVASVTAGSGITVTGTAGEGWTATVAHSDTSTQSSVDNSNGTVIQDITLDTYGHITALGSLDLDTRYYTETEVQTVLPKVGFNTTNIVAPSTAQLAWNQDERTLDLGLNGVTLQLGQEQLMYVRNGDGTTITNKTLCMAVGTIGNSGRIVVSKYDLSNPNLLVGMATEDILSGADGYVTVFGKVRAVDTSMWVDGQILYAAANGGLTATEPTTGIKQPVAFVVHAHTSGALFVRMTNLDENKYLVQANGVVDCGLITEQVR